MMLLLPALLMGGVAGFRAFVPLAVIAVAAHAGLVDLSGTVFSFMGDTLIACLMAGLVAIEILVDKLPYAPDRTAPVPFGLRVCTGAAAGAALAVGSVPVYLVAMVGVIGALAGTVLSRALRARLTNTFAAEIPAAAVEDLVAVAAAVLIVLYLV